jgi:hypothetical protein
MASCPQFPTPSPHTTTPTPQYVHYGSRCRLNPWRRLRPTRWNPLVHCRSVPSRLRSRRKVPTFYQPSNHPSKTPTAGRPYRTPRSGRDDHQNSTLLLVRCARHGRRFGCGPRRHPIPRTTNAQVRVFPLLPNPSVTHLFRRCGLALSFDDDSAAGSRTILEEWRKLESLVDVGCLYNAADIYIYSTNGSEWRRLPSCSSTMSRLRRRIPVITRTHLSTPFRSESNAF